VKHTSTKCDGMEGYRRPSDRNPNLARIKHTSFKRDVYEPAEDSFLLADVILEESILWERHPRFCVEIGSGSGYVICSLGNLVRTWAHDTYCLATDVNPSACLATKETLRNHGLDDRVEVVNCDLLGPLERHFHDQVDLLMFNPPYVVTPDEEVLQGGISAAWAGGCKGRMIIDRLLEKLDRLMAIGGRVYMIAIHDNVPEEIMETVRRRGFEATMVATQVADEEVLHVLRFLKTGTQKDN
jgi:release factor glutamine methyltransferase